MPQIKLLNNKIVGCKIDSQTLYDPQYFKDVFFDDNLLWIDNAKSVVRLQTNELVFEDDPKALEDARQRKRDEIAAARYAAETGSIEVDGATIATDRGSQALLTAAVVMARMDPEFKTQWKCADERFKQLDAFQLRAIGDAVIAHVETCFAREGELCEQIDAAQTPEELDAIQWSL